MSTKAAIEQDSTFNGHDYQNQKKIKKEKRSSIKEKESEIEGEGYNESTIRKSKKKKKKHKQSEELPTVSVAIAGSIIDNAQSLELATRLAGQIARAATIFRIDEVVVFDSLSQTTDNDSIITATSNNNRSESGACFLGLLPPLDAPHHVRKHEWSPYREGVTLKQSSNIKGTQVDVGLSKDVVVEQVLEVGKRVTVAMGPGRSAGTESLKQVVTSTSPREEIGLYWGYRVRYASNLSSVFNCSPYKIKYDHIIGTSEHGTVVTSSELNLPKFRHLLIVFGGLAGLEESIEEDSSLKGKNACDVFDSYLNVCPNQGSRTIRTEEAILISLQFFQEPIKKAMK